MFEHVTLCAMIRRCYTLLGITSVQNIRHFRCCPFKIQKFYKAYKKELLISEGKNSTKLLHGKVRTSYDNITDAERQDEARFIKDNFILNDDDVAEAFQLMTRLRLFNLKMPVTMIYRGDDQRLSAMTAMLHEDA
jgi:hypothetical protein